MGTRQEGQGGNEELKERKAYFCIFLYNYVERGFGGSSRGPDQLSPPSWGSSPSPCVSEVQSVRLSLRSCMMSVESL
jgi:hypothetical protein